MKNHKNFVMGATTGIAMLFIIFDARTAARSAYEGIELCLRTVIPSLLPFFVLSGVINSCLMGSQFRVLRPLGRLCKIPKGTESLLVLGFLAGYPVGAQLVTQSYQEGKISQKTARRMLGFCNNAGPGFLFGMLSPLFSSVKILWVLWLIQILCALIAGILIPATPEPAAHISTHGSISFAEALSKALRSLALVCGWVIIFRIIIGFCNRWFLWLLPTPIQILISGILELTNGCVLLNKLPCEGLRFLLSGALLAFGGLCVAMQTTSVTTGLGTGWYFPGKVLQTTLCMLICLLLQPVLFANTEVVVLPLSAPIGLILFGATFAFTMRQKKLWLFQKVYSII